MPRSNQTKRLLAQSLMDLMMTTPLEKISVNDIVDHAGVRFGELVLPKRRDPVFGGTLGLCQLECPDGSRGRLPVGK